MRGIKFILVILIFMAGRIVAKAQSDQYRFSRIDANHGLSHNQIKSFFKDSKGFMWFGTISGLNRYDGYNIRVFRNDPQDSTSIINDDVNKLFEDPAGRMWLVTWSGIDVYDPETETFRHNPRDILRSFSIPEGIISDIVKDDKGNYWFVHATQGLFCYSPFRKETRHIRHNDKDTASLHSSVISEIKMGTAGNVWVIHKDGTIESLDREKLKVTSRSFSLNRLLGNAPKEYRFIVDADDHLWIYIADTNKGIYYFNTSFNNLSHINKYSAPLRLNTDIVRSLVQDDRGIIWVATDHGGLNLIHKKKDTVFYVLHKPEDKNSLSQNSINVLYKDDEGIIWAGTFKRGVNYYHENLIRFQLYRHQDLASGRPGLDDVNCFAEDDKGNLWIGTNGGGLLYFDRSNNSFHRYQHNPNDANSPSNDVIVSLWLDRQKVLWLGTYFGGLNAFDGKRFRRYHFDPASPSAVSDHSIWEIYEDSRDRLWIGTLTRGVDVMNPDREVVERYSTQHTNTLHANYIPAIMEDREGNMWIGTGYGLEVFNRKAGTFTHYLSQPDNPNSLSNNSILSMIEDSRGMIWIGTHGGLNLFDKSTLTFRSFKQKHGLPHNSILTLVEDNNGKLWMSTPNGLSQLTLSMHDGNYDFSFKNYDEKDGLQGKQFNENAAIKLSTGELVFGGSGGFNIFLPDAIGINNKKPSVVLTDIQVFNKSVDIGEKVNGNVILHQASAYSKEMVLTHKDNVFSIEFAALSFFHPEKSIYRYNLEGFSKEWLTTNADQRRVTYTNLDPGTYVFKVMASNNDGIWNEKATELKITVLPPFWKTRTAFVFYIIVILAALLLTRSLIQQRERMKFAIEQERQEAQRMHELDMMKIRFFTNVSHEFRTPLTLILTPLERIMNNTRDKEQSNQFQLIYRNAKRLLNLVNQLLDFRKLEVQEIKFNPSEGDIVKYIKDTVYSFSDLSEKKEITLDFHSSILSLETIFDQDKLEKILFNLLSNAFKFTPAHGAVSVGLDIMEDNQQKWLEIKVKDTGIGVPADKQEKIFERFFQHDLPRSMVNQGSGIGLSITKEFVRIHGGTIRVESAVGQGSCFIITIPVKDVAVHAETVSREAISLPVASSGPGLQEVKTASKLPTLLLVEDNEDFRFYLKDNLKAHYRILEASDGKDGWEKTLSTLPDLIVSDVMMPEMNGMELCRKIKNDSRVSHIPVILLTARTAEEQKVEGFKTGADDYITKPFNFEILQSRIKNLIHQRELLHRDFGRKISVKASTLTVTSLDEKLIQKAIKCVEERVSDAEFSVEDLSRELGMSRVHLYKKLQALTGKSPLEFIRSIRLQHAAQLLEKSQLTVSEVAYKVGFNNPKYFAKYFKEEFHLLPSVYASSRRKSEEGNTF